jgi:hypothetical protein
MQGNDTNIIVRTKKVKAFIGKLDLGGQKTRRKKFGNISSFDVFCGGNK